MVQPELQTRLSEGSQLRFVVSNAINYKLV